MLHTVAPGKSADFIVTRENPLEDLRALQHLELVVCCGRAVKNPSPKRRKEVDTPGSQIRISARSSGPGPCTWSRPTLGWATGCSVWSPMSCNGQIRFGKDCLYPLTEAAGDCFNGPDKRE